MPIVSSCGGFCSGGGSVVAVNLAPRQILVYNDRFGCYSNGSVQVNSSGTGIQIINSGTGNDLVFKTLKPGNNVTLTEDGNEITISSSQSIATSGGGSSLINDTASTLTLKSIIQGDNTTIIDNGTELQINSMQSFNNIGNGNNIANSNGSTIDFKSINAGDNVSIIDDGTTLTINASGQPVTSGTNTTVIDTGTEYQINTFQAYQNTGNGMSLLSDNNASISAKTLVPGWNIFIDDLGDSLQINALDGAHGGAFPISITGGDNSTVVQNGNDFIVNTLQLINNLGNGIFLSSVNGSAIDLKSIKAGNNISITDNGSDLTIDSIIKPVISGNNTTVIDDGSNFIINTLQQINNTGTGNNIAAINGSSIDFKTLTAGPGITISDNGNEIQINADDNDIQIISGDNTTLISTPNGVQINSFQNYNNIGNGTVLAETNGSSIDFKTLTAGTGIVISENNGEITIVSTDVDKTIESGNNITVTDTGNSYVINSMQSFNNMGIGNNIVGVSGSTLNFKTILAGSHITVNNTGSELQINGIDTISGDNTTVIDNGTNFEVNSFQNYTNTGNGNNIISTNGSSYNVKTLTAGSGINITDNGNELSINYVSNGAKPVVAGANVSIIENQNNFNINSMQAISNTGLGSAVASSSGSTLYFKTINAGSGLSINETSDEIQISFNSGNIQAPSTIILNDMNDLYNTVNPNPGQLAFVKDMGQNEWGLFLWVGSTWLQISSTDSAASDANSFVINFDFNSNSQLYIGRVSSGSVITSVAVQIDNVFDDSPNLNVGILADHSILMDFSIIELNNVGESYTESNVQFNGPVETEIYAFFDKGTSTSGSGKIIVNYS